MYRCKTYVHKYRFMTELQTRWWLYFFETVKVKSDINNLDEMCVGLGTNVPRETSKSIGRNLLAELGRCLDDRLTVSDKELNA